MAETIEAQRQAVIFGGNGYVGWPAAINFANEGWKVTIVDSLVRDEKIDPELGIQSVTPIQPIERRLDAWEEVAGSDKKIEFVRADIAEDYGVVRDIISGLCSKDIIIHLAQQRAAPYSMIDRVHKAYTRQNNRESTNNILDALVETEVDAHLLKLGTMGIYGYGGIEGNPIVPEGWLKVMRDTPEGLKEWTILHPTKAGSIYHLSKVHDLYDLDFYNRTHGLRITDLEQGIVWGTQTALTRKHPDLINKFDSDGVYGTVLNRFLAQAAVGHPLTVYGEGGQKRAFINIEDTSECLRLAALNPPETGERLQIRNQMTEVFSVEELAKTVSDITGAEISYVDNPRKELPRNDLDVDNSSFLNIHLKPITLTRDLLLEAEETALKYKDRIRVDKIVSKVKWLKSRNEKMAEPQGPTNIINKPWETIS